MQTFLIWNKRNIGVAHTSSPHEVVGFEPKEKQRDVKCDQDNGWGNQEFISKLPFCMWP